MKARQPSQLRNEPATEEEATLIRLLHRVLNCGGTVDIDSFEPEGDQYYLDIEYQGKPFRLMLEDHE